MSLFARQPGRIQFLCEPQDKSVIAPPVPAKTYLPDWFRRLPAIDETQVSPQDTGLTIKRCMPFLDAMSTGWIIPLPATVRLDIRDGGERVEAGWDFDRTLVSFHGAHQVRGNPMAPRVACKFHNFWTIVTPPGWSCLFVNPLNRPNGVFEVIAGIVDTDSYKAPVHFPFFPIAPDGLHVIEKGSPLVQVIPFRRDSAGLPAEIRSETGAEKAARKSVTRNTQAAAGWYRTDARARR
ncbi:DUF6065 family protein [Maritimibacter sp. DP1N21-5]|uniref:DUF6065 family protein n=1 Tax=Maritimibacter sp. DP1N21-5 TaxID=2836867 RepID=UPI001C46779B|nr:DUF6065 family protein [Maritimibacter sp. DP1N21-5]MBV7409686.1 hypothetical protein [Maritimibacter sp. DP1N21-5]